MQSGLITSVTPGSLAQRVGLRAEDELVAINGHPLRDLIDVRFYASEQGLTFRVRRDGKELTRRGQRRYDEPLGIEFARPTFDTDLRRCSNRCDFCFVDQVPSGLRRSLYIKDDDYRYSFLFGNYVTLTNLRPEDWARISDQHLSPLYVSVHATDADLRRRMLRNPSAPDVMDQLHRLADTGIEAHTQVVVVPEQNDGPALDRTIGDLATLYPAVRSLSVVPLGLTKYHRGECRLQTREEAHTVLKRVTDWQERLRDQLGVHFVYLSDEWYLRLGEEVPSARASDGLDLTENGVGLTRTFLDQWAQLERGMSNAGWPTKAVTLVTGELFAPVLRQATAHLAGVEIVAVVNHFFGRTVTVAGLLTAQDVIAQLEGRALGARIVLPTAMFGGPQEQSLDEKRPEDVREALGQEVATADSARDLSAALAPPGAHLNDL